jgi:hypothetical protein
MNILSLLFACIMLLPGCSDAEAKVTRSSSVVIAFKYANPCPSTGMRHGSCPGYIVDHIMPLACGGADAVSNMQWMTVQAAKAKDRWEIVGNINHKPCSGDKI